MESSIEKRSLPGVDVYIGKDVVSQILPRLRLVFEEGALCVVFEEEYRGVANALMQELKSGGYRVFAMSSDCDESEQPPDYVRYVFAVGQEDCAVRAKALAVRTSVSWSMLLCAPCSDDICCRNCPKQVFIDENILLKCRNEQIAAGYGIVLSQKLCEFERTFQRLILGKQTEDFSCPTAFDSQSELAFCLLEISLKKCGRSSAERVADVMRALALSKGRKPRLSGEYRFLASATLCSFYSLFLSSPSIDCAPPSCAFDARDALSSLVLRVNEGKCVDFFDANHYFRIGYILGEYRLDLLEKLASIDVHGMQRFWRRLYLDAGYWLKGEISASEVLWCIRVAAEGSDLLDGYAFASGVFERFVA